MRVLRLFLCIYLSLLTQRAWGPETPSASQVRQLRDEIQTIFSLSQTDLSKAIETAEDTRLLKELGYTRMGGTLTFDYLPTDPQRTEKVFEAIFEKQWVDSQKGEFNIYRPVFDPGLKGKPADITDPKFEPARRFYLMTLLVRRLQVLQVLQALQENKQKERGQKTWISETMRANEAKALNRPIDPWMPDIKRKEAMELVDVYFFLREQMPDVELPTGLVRTLRGDRIPAEFFDGPDFKSPANCGWSISRFLSGWWKK